MLRHLGCVFVRWSPDSSFRSYVRFISDFGVAAAHVDAGEIEIDDDEIELAAEHFLAMVEALPSRLAEFGVFRSNKQAERHLQYAVKLFLRAVAPTDRKVGAGQPRSTARASTAVGGRTKARQRRTPVR